MSIDEARIAEAVAAEPTQLCADCLYSPLAVSRSRPWDRVLWWLFGYAPFRCLRCGRRYRRSVGRGIVGRMLLATVRPARSAERHG